MILEHFEVGAEQYAVVFTANTTHALQLVADTFNFGEKFSPDVCIGAAPMKTGPTFAYLRDSHNSVVGMREIVRSKVDNIIVLDDLEEQLLVLNGSGGLFAMTAMSNFCGRKYDLSVIDALQKEDAVNFLTPRTFAGGTVSQLLVDELRSVVRENIEEGLEYGTSNYYAICTLTKGFADLERYGGIRAINEKTKRIAKSAYEVLKSKVHWNGKPALEIYGWLNPSQQGPIVSFNLLKDDGSYTGYSEVEKMAALFGIELRTGCFCNSGACQMYLNITNKQQLEYYKEGKKCGDGIDLIDGRPTGAVRISFGRQSVAEDVLILDQMIEYCFLGVQPSSNLDHPMTIDCYSAQISRLIVYPVKSCHGINLEKSLLTKTGLRYDRIFMVDCCGTVLTQKREPKMCKLSAEVQESDGMLVLSSTEDPTSYIRVPLFGTNEPPQGKIICVNKWNLNNPFTEKSIVWNTSVLERTVAKQVIARVKLLEVKKSVQTSECAVEISKWLTSFFGLPDCKLQRVSQGSNKSLSNEAPYLVVNEASIKILADAVGLSISEAIDRFRPNIVVRGIPPFIEDTAKYMIIDNFRFEVIKKCTRCEMICVNPNTGIKEPQLIVALRDFRGKQKMTFGIYVKQIDNETGEIHQNSHVHFE